MQKILIVFGTRPEAIKMAPLVKEFQKHSDAFETKVCVTAQHREMLDQVLNLFEIIPDYDLDIMKAGQDLYDVTSNVFLGLKPVLSEFKPDVVLDTESTPSTDGKSCEAVRNTSHVTRSTISDEVRNTHINIGTGIDISIHDLAYMIKDIVGFNGELYFNTDKPDGTMKKLTDVSKLHGLGWKHSVDLKDGIEKMYQWYTESNK